MQHTVQCCSGGESLVDYVKIKQLETEQIDRKRGKRFGDLQTIASHHALSPFGE